MKYQDFQELIDEQVVQPGTVKIAHLDGEVEVFENVIFLGHGGPLLDLWFIDVLDRTVTKLLIPIDTADRIRIQWDATKEMLDSYRPRPTAVDETDNTH